MSEKEYLVKNTGTNLDDMIILCEEGSHPLYFSDDIENEVPPIYCREIKMFLDEDEDRVSSGVFVAEDCLVPVFKENENSNPSGKYIKSYSFEIFSHKFNLVEFDEVLQVSVVENKSLGRTHIFPAQSDNVLYSSYKHKKDLHKIKRTFESCVEGYIKVEDVLQTLESLPAWR